MTTTLLFIEDAPEYAMTLEEQLAYVLLCCSGKRKTLKDNRYLDTDSFSPFSWILIHFLG
jgi:hypothetical protein